MSITVITILVGIGVLIIGGLFLRRESNLRKVCTRQVNGQVIDVIREVSEETERDKDTGRTTTRKTEHYYPVYSYLADGREIIRKSSTGTNRSRFSKGESVTVFYNPDKVEQYYVLEDKASSRFGIIIIVLGGVLTLVGIFFVR